MVNATGSPAGSNRTNAIRPFGPATFAWAGPGTAIIPSRIIPAAVASAISRLTATTPLRRVPEHDVEGCLAGCAL